MVRGGWWPRLPVALLLALCATYAYFPALDRVFVADQIGYFAELQGETSLAAGLGLLDYGASRQYAKGDQLLYRPLMFAGLAVENALFRRDFRAWNVANLVVHLLVSYLLFEVLWRLRRSVLACGVALWFALLAANFELVTWNHLGGYMLGYGLLLLALFAAREAVAEQAGRRWFWIYGVAMACAMLEHEIAVVAGFGVAAHALWRRWRKCGQGDWRWLAAALAPALIYAVLYAYHVSQCDRLFWVNPHEGGAVTATGRLAAVPALLLNWGQHILLPRTGQLAFSALRRSLWTPAADGLTGEVLAALALWAGAGFSLWRGFSRQHLKAAWPFGAALAVLILAYAGLNLTGRPAYAMQVPYYDYFPALFGAVGLYALIDFSRVGRVGQTAALAFLLLLAAGNGALVRRTGERLQEMNRPLARYLEWVEQTVRPKLSDPNFSFAVRGVPSALDLTGPLVFGYPDQGMVVTIPLLHFLYGKSYDSATPAETFDFPRPEAELP